MKKILLLSNLVTAALLAALLLKGCSMPQGDESQTEAKALASTAKKEDIVLNYADSVFKSLTIDQALAMKKAFVDGNPNSKDTKSITFSLSAIKNMVWYIEHHTNQTNLKINPDSLGVTVHFAQYPSKTVLDNLGFEMSEKKKEDYANRKTVFFVPTVRRNGTLVEFDPKRNHMESGKSEYKDIIPLSIHYSQMNRTPFRNVDYNNESPIANLGKIEPPYTDDYQ
jgi:hypothetical protein